jgi:hypothetical protein
MRALSLADAVKINPDVLFRELDGEAVLLSLETGIYYGLDPVGTTVWRLIGEHGSLRLVFDAMLREYDVEESVLERELLRLVNDLCAHGLSAPADSGT